MVVSFHAEIVSVHVGNSLAAIGISPPKKKPAHEQCDAMSNPHNHITIFSCCFLSYKTGEATVLKYSLIFCNIMLHLTFKDKVLKGAINLNFSLQLKK